MKVNQTGFTLLEVMVAVFVLAIGLLGMAHLQTLSLKANKTAELTSQATILAVDIFDRMRANTNATFAGQYNIGMNTATPNAGNTIVSQDLNEWRTLLAANLPSGKGSITCPNYDSSSELICTVTLQWTEIQTGQAANTNYNDYATSSFTMVSAI